MSTFLSFPSIHHIFKVSTLFRRKHTQVARYDRDVFFRVFDRSLFEKAIFRSLVSIYNFKHSRLLYTNRYDEVVSILQEKTGGGNDGNTLSE